MTFLSFINNPNCITKVEVTALLKKEKENVTHDDVDALAGAGGSDEETGLLVGDEQLHETRVPHRVHRRHDDLVKHSVLGDGRRVLQLLRPLLPASEALKGETHSQSHWISECFFPWLRRFWIQVWAYWKQVEALKGIYSRVMLCSYLASTPTSPSTFNIVSMVAQTQTQGIGLDPFSASTFA